MAQNPCRYTWPSFFQCRSRRSSQPLPSGRTPLDNPTCLCAVLGKGHGHAGISKALDSHETVSLLAIFSVSSVSSVDCPAACAMKPHHLELALRRLVKFKCPKEPKLNSKLLFLDSWKLKERLQVPISFCRFFPAALPIQGLCPLGFGS